VYKTGVCPSLAGYLYRDGRGYAACRWPEWSRTDESVRHPSPDGAGADDGEGDDPPDGETGDGRAESDEGADDTDDRAGEATGGDDPGGSDDG